MPIGRRSLATIEERAEVVAVEVFHHQAQLFGRGHHVQHRGYVRMLDARREPRLIEEHGYEIRITSKLLVEPLDGDRAAKPEWANVATM